MSVLESLLREVAFAGKIPVTVSEVDFQTNSLIAVGVWFSMAAGMSTGARAITPTLEVDSRAVMVSTDVIGRRFARIVCIGSVLHVSAFATSDILDAVRATGNVDDSKETIVYEFTSEVVVDLSSSDKNITDGNGRHAIVVSSSATRVLLNLNLAGDASSNRLRLGRRCKVARQGDLSTGCFFREEEAFLLTCHGVDKKHVAVAKAARYMANMEDVLNNKDLLGVVRSFSGSNPKLWSKQLGTVATSIRDFEETDVIDSVAKFEIAKNTEAYELSHDTIVSALLRGDVRLAKDALSMGCPFSDVVSVRILDQYSESKKGAVFNALKLAHGLGCPPTVEVLDVAAGTGDVELFEWIVSKCLDVFPVGIQVLGEAAGHGHLELVKKIHNIQLDEEDDGIAAMSAAKIGRLDILEYLHSKEYEVNECAFVTAAGGGHINVLDWLEKKQISMSGEEDQVVDAAVIGGHLEVMNWLYARKYPFGGTLYHGTNGNPDVIAWLRAKKVPMCSHVIVPLAATGNLKLMKELRPHVHLNNCVMEILATAAEMGHRHVMEWALDQVNPDVPHTSKEGEAIMASAAKGGHLGLLQWLSGWFELSPRVLEAAIDSKDNATIRWLLYKECPMSEGAVKACVRTNNFDILLVLHDSGCPIDENICDVAAEWSRMRMLKWLGDRFPVTSNTSTMATRNGHFQMVRFLHEELDCAWDHELCEEACRIGHVGILRYALENGCEWDYHFFCESWPLKCILDFMDSRGRDWRWELDLFVPIIQYEEENESE
jgi:hypothetical protein